MKWWSLVLLLVMAPVALAHDPKIETEDWGAFDDPYVLPDATISYALYGYVDNDDPEQADIDVFQMDFAEADAMLRGEILVPVCGEHYTEFYPEFVILAPVEDANPRLDMELPFEMPKGWGVLYHYSTVLESLRPLEERPAYILSHTGTEYYESGQLEESIPAAGTYLLVVYEPNGHSGDYTLATGYREVFNSPREEVMEAVEVIQSNEWLHRDCALDPDDPDAVIKHEH